MAAPLDLNSIFQQFLAQQAQQQQQGGANALDLQRLRMQGQREQNTDVHRGMSGGIIDPTTGKEAGNAFDNGFFHPHVGPTYNDMSPAGTAAAFDTTMAQNPSMHPGSSFNFSGPDPVAALDATLTAPSGPKPAMNSPAFPGFADAAIARTNSATTQQNAMRNPTSAPISGADMNFSAPSSQPAMPHPMVAVAPKKMLPPTQSPAYLQQLAALGVPPLPPLPR